MVLATMADSSEREELEELIEEWNATRLDMFTISEPDADLEFSGNMRFYFQESGSKDTKVQTKVLRVSSSDTTDEVMKILVSKFHPDMKMLTVPNYSLYEVHETGAEAHKLEMDQRPLYVQLYWQREDRDGRFLLKSEDDKMTQKLFGEEESARNPDKRNSKLRQSKMKGKNKKKTEEKPKNIATELYGAKPASSFTRSKSNPEAVMKRQRKKKLEDRLQKIQDPQTSGGGGGPLRIFAESLQPENPYKTILCASNDTTETVLKDALEKYEVPPEEMDQYCLTMVTIAPGNHSDPESSSGIKERVVPDKDCPAAIAASWPESSGELRFYLKKKQNMPKRKQQPRKRQDEAHRRASDRPALTNEHSPPPVKETTFDVIDHSSTEKEPGSPAVHIVDAARDLPATLEFRESGEDAFFAVVVSEVNGSAVNFKLAPTFTLYMCCRYRLSPKFHPDFPPNKRREKVMGTANKVANMMWQTVKENNGMAGHLAFWMANSSELLHFLKQDMELSSVTEESQKILAHTTQQAFRSLVQCIKSELQKCLPAFLDPSEETDLDEHGENSIDEKFDPMDGYQSTERSFKVRHYGPHGQPLGGDQWMGKKKKTSRPVVGDVLYTLKAAMSLLRRCRVNPALTIQLFSQVFHHINMWLFNRIVLETQLRLCTRSWGVRLRERLKRLQVWAESQGLELAAECHLARVSQAALLLQLPKQDSTAISSHCYKLNSLQIRQLLELYQPERDEPAIPLELIEKAVSVAESTADEIARSEGQKVTLEEEPELHLPFLLPDDGYSSEKICGVPPGLKEFLDPLITPGLCRLTIQPKASGQWTVHFKIPAGLESPPPEVIKISINKGTKGMGVSIVAAKGAAQEKYGIYVKEVIDGGPASLDGRLNTGDQILDVNGESLVGIQQEDAVKILIKAGSVVNMTVAKKAVYKHGLVELLSNVAPVQKAAESLNRPPENRNVSPLTQKKETPRPPPRYRPPQDSPQRSPPLNASVQSEVDGKLVKPEQKQVKPEAVKRRSPYDRNAYEPAEQPPVQTKTVVEYQLDEPPHGRKPPVGVKVGVPLPHPADIQRRQKEMQQRKAEEQEKENLEREMLAREQERLKKLQEEREEAERLERIKREEQARQEREKIEREQQERQRIERERQERERLEREKQERERKEKEQQERQKREKEEQERQRREEAERKRREEWEKRERERIEREELERQRQEEWRKQEQERLEREQREKEEQEKRMRQENAGLDEMTRRERELEMMLEQKRREKAERVKELERQLKQEQEESERLEKELRERLMKNREERKESQRMGRPSDDLTQRRSVGGSTQVHYVNNQEQQKSEIVRNEEIRPNRPARAPTPAEENRGNPPMDSRRPPLPNENTRGNFVGPANDIRSDDPPLNRPVDHNRRGPVVGNENRDTPPLPRKQQVPPEGNRGNYSPGKRPTLQNSKDDSFDMDPAEIERQFQQRLAEEASGKSEIDGAPVQVIRIPVQKGNWDSREREVEDRPRVRVDWQREEEEKHRKEQQWRREQDELLVRDFQQSENFRQQPAGAVAEPIHPHQGEWERDDELRRQQQEDDRLREARANQLRNRIIERPEDDEDIPDASTRTRRVQFASVRTEIIQPSPDAERQKAGVVFVHDNKVEDSDDEEFPRPPPPAVQEDAPIHPPLPQNQPDYYRRPPPPPKPQNLVTNGGGNPPGEANPPHYRDNEHVTRARVRLSEDGYATYPGPSRQQQNNNYPVPKPRGSASTEFSPDNTKLPFKDKMKVFNETTPPKRQMTSKWEQRWVNGDSL